MANRNHINPAFFERAVRFQHRLAAEPTTNSDKEVWWASIALPFILAEEFEAAAADEVDRWKKALYSCTPGMGSECIDDPELCARRIQDTRHNLMEHLRKVSIQ